MSYLSLSQRDQKALWHPFTQHFTADVPIAIASGKGACLYDEQGKEYIDGIASWWVNLHGHAHPYIAEKIHRQALELEHVIFANFTHKPAVELAERLLETLPNNLGKVFFSDNGSTATEVAIKMALQYWHNLHSPRHRIIALSGAYHGDTFGAMSVGGRSIFSAPFEPLLFDVQHIEAPVMGCEKQCLQQLEAVLDNFNDIAAIIVEPLVQGAAGMRLYSAEVLEQIFQKCHEQGVLCIADEVMTGFYRTGRFWACDYINSKPDIVCCSKGITGGTMALGATICTQAIFDAFCSSDSRKTFFHGHSYTANPIACAAALASLDLLQTPDCLANIERITRQHQAFIPQLQYCPNITNVRQQGILLAMDITANPNPLTSEMPLPSLRDVIWRFFIARGLLLRPLGNTVYLLPPYCISNVQLLACYTGIIELSQHLQHQQWQGVDNLC